MDWLDAFDPASASSRARNALAQQRPGPSRAAQSAGPATSSSQQPEPAHYARPQPGHASQPPRPSYGARPPQRFSTRTPAAPPSAALRSEDAQPNEYQIRSKPWELAVPPSIGASRSKPSQPLGRPPIARPAASGSGQTQSKKRPAPSQQQNRPSRSQRRAMNQQSAMQQQHQQAPTPQQPTSSKASSTKPKPKSKYEAIISSHLKPAGQAPSQPQKATPKSITVHDIHPEIPLWTEDAKYQARRALPSPTCAAIQQTKSGASAKSWLR